MICEFIQHSTKGGGGVGGEGCLVQQQSKNLLPISALWHPWFAARLANRLILGAELGTYGELGFQSHSASTVPGPKQHTRDTTENEVLILFHRGFQFQRGVILMRTRQILFHIKILCEINLLSTEGASKFIKPLLCEGVCYQVWKKNLSWYFLITTLLCFLLFNRWEMLFNFSVKKDIFSMAQQHELAFLILHGVESSQNVYVSKWWILDLWFFLISAIYLLLYC